MFEIGQLNRRIVIKNWTTFPDDGGGLSAAVVSSYSIWAKVEARNGRLFTGEQQALWSYDYKVTFRYEKSRVVSSNDTIDYDGKRLSINSLSFLEEGNRKYSVARCSATDAIADDPDVTGVEPSIASLGMFHYYGVGGETSFIESTLIGKTIITAFKDGIEFEVILTGSPAGKQVLYNVVTGEFTWGVAYSVGEYTLIVYK